MMQCHLCTRADTIDADGLCPICAGVPILVSARRWVAANAAEVLAEQVAVVADHGAVALL